MRLAVKNTVAYFKSVAYETGISHQSPISSYLCDCAIHHRKLKMKRARD